jgi:hypothetical protein
MNRVKGNRLLKALVVCALGLSALAAAPSSAGAPQALQNEQALSGFLTGNGGGAFDYYAINYPGDESVVTIELRYHPADPVTKLGVGFNVYASNGFYIGPGQFVADTGGDGVLQLQYGDGNAATWLVQVYNYIPGASIGYTIMAEGLPAIATVAEPAPPVAEVVTTPETAAPGEPLTASGSLTGNAGGAYAVYKVTVPADAADVQVTMTWSPDDPVIATGVGFVGYGPSGQVRRGAGTGNPGQRKATLAASAPGVYEIQVYNYIGGLTIQYALSSAAAGD